MGKILSIIYRSLQGSWLHMVWKSMCLLPIIIMDLSVGFYPNCLDFLLLNFLFGIYQ